MHAANISTGCFWLLLSKSRTKRESGEESCGTDVVSWQAYPRYSQHDQTLPSRNKCFLCVFPLLALQGSLVPHHTHVMMSPTEPSPSPVFCVYYKYTHHWCVTSHRCHRWQGWADLESLNIPLKTSFPKEVTFTVSVAERWMYLGGPLINLVHSQTASLDICTPIQFIWIFVLSNFLIDFDEC